VCKTVTGLNKSNPAGIEYLPQTSILNPDITAAYTVVFVGDIMPQDGKNIVFGQTISDFIKGSDFFIGNFEGTIAEKKMWSGFVTSDLYHTENVVDTLSGLFPPEKTYLSMANNHSGDLGRDAFLKTVNVLEERGFHVFGWSERPFADINDEIRIIPGTMWSNRKRDYVLMLEGAGSWIKQGAFNVLYPHFGYELELYPRPEIVEESRKLIKIFDALVGHHSHSPQPVTLEKVNGKSKILAYSLGDFSGALTTKKFQYGIVLKMEIGRDKEGRWLAGRVEWRKTRCAPEGEGYVVEVTEECIAQSA
jgi:poly-gamma-glutamate capsule biosynthesis protein CapA/YwtB (metallophosphatase superfamily)